MKGAEASHSETERAISTPAQHASGSSDRSRLHLPIPRSLVTALSGHLPPRVTPGMSDDFQCSHIFVGHNRAFLQQQDHVISMSTFKPSFQRYNLLKQGSCRVLHIVHLFFDTSACRATLTELAGISWRVFAWTRESTCWMRLIMNLAEMTKWRSVVAFFFHWSITALPERLRCHASPCDCQGAQ